MNLRQQIKHYCIANGSVKTILDYRWIGDEYLSECLGIKKHDVLAIVNDKDLVIEDSKAARVFLEGRELTR